MEVWSQWCPVAWPFGRLIFAVFSKRLQQLALPLRPMDTAHGMDSRVVAAVDGEGVQVGAAWLRSLQSTGQTVYSGWYGITTVTNRDSPSVRVVFPLPNGIQVRRVYDTPARGDGTRVLVDRIWPWGLTKGEADLDEWWKEVAPSTELRKWPRSGPVQGVHPPLPCRTETTGAIGRVGPLARAGEGPDAC